MTIDGNWNLGIETHLWIHLIKTRSFFWFKSEEPFWYAFSKSIFRTTPCCLFICIQRPGHHPEKHFDIHLWTSFLICLWPLNTLFMNYNLKPFYRSLGPYLFFTSNALLPYPLKIQDFHDLASVGTPYSNMGLRYLGYPSTQGLNPLPLRFPSMLFIASYGSPPLILLRLQILLSCPLGRIDHDIVWMMLFLSMHFFSFSCWCGFLQ